MFLNRCIWTPTAGGLADFVVSAAAQNGYVPANCLSPTVISGATYHYFAITATEHEEGDGVFTGSTLARTTIRNSSNAAAKVNFSLVPTVFMGGPIATDLREKLTADRTYYVRADGNNSNTGLTNTAGGAFLTINGAISAIFGAIDFGAHVVTLNVVGGPWAEYVLIDEGWVGGGQFVISGDGSSTTTLNSAGGNAAIEVRTTIPGILVVRAIKLGGNTGITGYGLAHFGSGLIIIADDVEFASVGTTQIAASAAGASIQVTNTRSTSYAVSGTSLFHTQMGVGATLQYIGQTIVCKNLPVYTFGFHSADYTGTIVHNVVTYVDHNGKTRQTATGDTHSNTTLDNLSTNTSNLSVGMAITGSGIPVNTTIFSIDTASKVTMSAAATTTVGGGTVKFEIALSDTFGARYRLTGNSVISTSGSGADYLPGTRDGISATGGQYL